MTKLYMAVDQYGHTYHIGYIIGGLWLRLYEVSPVMNALI